MRRIFGKGRYATVTSTLALVVALSGTAYAAATVTGAQIVNGTIRGQDIATGTIAGIDIRNGTVRPPDLAPDTVAPRLFARVNFDGTLAASAGVIANTHDDEGVYTITFNQGIDQCAWSATLGVVFPLVVATQPSGSTAVTVHIGDLMAQDPFDNRTDADFHLVVTC